MQKDTGRNIKMNRDLTCFIDPENGGRLIPESGSLNSEGGRRYPIIRGIPRFVSAENYSEDFGAQWNMFPKTQLDSFTGLAQSETRLARCLRGNLASLGNKKVLEAGSGAGRFTEVLLKYGAVVHSFDYSNAIEANAKNNGHHERLVLAQADIRKMPFPKGDYDYVICLGVLQHTPNPEESIKCLWEMAKPGGVLTLDHYLWKWQHILPPPIGCAEVVYRQLILRLPRNARFKFVKALTDFWFPWHWRFKDSPFVQRLLGRVSPVHFYYPHFKLRDRQMYYEWALLDTHDGTTDFYKHYRTPHQIRKILEQIGASDIFVEIGGNGVEGFCRKPEK
jgi:SAM-dependent methyltransferase